MKLRKEAILYWNCMYLNNLCNFRQSSLFSVGPTRAGRTLCATTCPSTSASSSCRRRWAGLARVTTGPLTRPRSTCSRRAPFGGGPGAFGGRPLSRTTTSTRRRCPAWTVPRCVTWATTTPWVTCRSACLTMRPVFSAQRSIHSCSTTIMYCQHTNHTTIHR